MRRETAAPRGRRGAGVAGPVAPDRLTALPSRSDDEIPYPILRLHRRFWGTQVVAFYEDFLLAGLRPLRRFVPEEEDFEEGGADRLAERLTFVRRIPYSEIEHSREWFQRKMGLPELLTWAPRREQSRFKVKARGRWPLFFKMPAEEAPSVRGVLARHGGRRIVREWRVSLLPILLAVVGALIVAGGLVLWAGRGGPLIEGTVQGGEVPPLLAPVFLALGLGFLLFAAGAWRWLALRVHDWLDRRAAREDLRRLPEGSSRKAAFLRSLPILLKVFGLFLVVGYLALKTELDIARSTDSTAVLILPGLLLVYLGDRLARKNRWARPSGGDVSAGKPIVLLGSAAQSYDTSLQPTGLLAAATGVRDSLQLGTYRTDGNPTRFSRLALLYHPIRFLRTLFGYHGASAEEALAHHLRPHGPVLALGPTEALSATPAEHLALLPGQDGEEGGTSPGVSSEDPWTESVHRILEQARAVLLVPDPSPDLPWELTEALDTAPYDTVLCCLANHWRRPQAYEDLWLQLRDRYDLELPRTLPYLDRPVFLWFHEQGEPAVQPLSYRSPVAWPLTVDAADLAYTLEPFVGRMVGAAAAAEPREVRWPRGWGRWWRLVVAFLIAFVLAAGLAAVAEMLDGWVGEGPEIPAGYEPGGSGSR